MKTLKILSLLLSYPTEDVMPHLTEMAGVLEKEGMLTGKPLKGVKALIGELAGKELMETQEFYVDTFDRGRSCSLHLFEHVHGESRARGQAMVDLAGLYRSKGFDAATGELPDYLPLFLEYLSLCPPEEAKNLLGETAHIVAALGQKLEKRDNPYAALFTALAALADLDLAAIKPLAVEEPEDLDKEWEEPPVFGADACKSCNVFTKTSAAIEKALGETK